LLFGALKNIGNDLQPASSGLEPFQDLVLKPSDPVRGAILVIYGGNIFGLRLFMETKL
jgi:hypothetical protein